MRCSVKTCENQGVHHLVVIARGVVAGESVRVRMRLPLVACVVHNRPGAFWAAVLRTVPRTFSALLANCGVAVPRLHRTRIRFVPIASVRTQRLAAHAEVERGPWD